MLSKPEVNSLKSALGFDIPTTLAKIQEILEAPSGDSNFKVSLCVKKKYNHDQCFSCCGHFQSWIPSLVQIMYDLRAEMELFEMLCRVDMNQIVKVVQVQFTERTTEQERQRKVNSSWRNFLRKETALSSVCFSFLSFPFPSFFLSSSYTRWLNVHQS